MAPFRGSRGSRGSRGNRGGRGVRAGRGGRGHFRGQSTENGKLARSGIRTRGGYRKFDSQRVKEVESDDSEHGEPEGEDVGEEQVEEGLSESDDEESTPAARAYNTLLQTFQPPAEENEVRRKRRKIELKEDVKAGGDDGEESEEEVDAQIRQDIDEDEDEEDDDLANGEALHIEDSEDTSDPFEIHFANPDDNELSRRLKSIQTIAWRTGKESVAGIGTMTVSAPSCIEGTITRKSALSSADGLPLKKRLADSIQNHMATLDPIQQAISPYIFNYNDLLLTTRTPHNADSLRMLACLHALNHVLKGRDKVLKNSARLSQPGNQDLELRDQGFTRPKVLILLETRQMCAKYAECIVQLFAPEQQENKQRFLTSFSSPTDTNESMPEDYRELFEGNNDNDFLTALKFTRKTLRFYSPFYTSDIILASPLGLRRVLENEDAKKRDHDPLSSIEIAIVDQADAMYMQNWTNVEMVFEHLNLLPQNSSLTDFSRVRSWYLDNNAKYLRQTLVFSAYLTPSIHRLFNTSMLNIAGKAKLTPLPTKGAIATIDNGIKQTFSRLDASSPSNDPDARFKYFTSTILPTLLRSAKPSDGAKGILIFIPSYYDFLRIRNFFATSTLTEHTSFGSINEYTTISSQRRARSHFSSGRHSVLLYTQRAHHFFRLRIRGVKKVVWYGLPENVRFYEEVAGGFLGTSVEEGKVGGEEAAVRVVFSRWDAIALERVVGLERVMGMLAGKGDVFEFV